MNHNPYNIKIGDWVVLDNHEDNPVKVYGFTPTFLFAEVGNNDGITWGVMTNRLKPKNEINDEQTDSR